MHRSDAYSSTSYSRGITLLHYGSLLLVRVTNDNSARRFPRDLMAPITRRMPNKAFFMRLFVSCKLQLFVTLVYLCHAMEQMAFNNIVGKGEIAGYHFPQCFLPFPKQISIFWIHLFCRLEML